MDIVNMDIDSALDKETTMRKCWHLDVTMGRARLVINPVVTVASICFIWLFVILCMVEPDMMLKAMDIAAFDWIPEVWTWFYIVSQDIWIAVLIYVMIKSKYGDLKLGKEDDKPEFSFMTWFSMLFSAGVAVGLFYYSVAEPMWHYKGWGGARWNAGNKGYGNENEDATHAIMVTWYHWGVHGWIPYTTVGAVLGIMTYRRGKPMTMRYCVWPLIGERCYGWMGDCIDILSIVTTMFGVCTSLGLGAMQINQGLQRLDHGFYRGVNYKVPDEEKYSTPTCGGTGQTCAEGKEPYGIQNNISTQVIIILAITSMASISVVTGLSRGIVNMSRFNFALGMGLVLTVLFLGETYFCLDTIVQTFGYYIWYLPKISFQTDAFERLGFKDMGLGGAPDAKGGSNSWLSSWTIFYWGWWIAWGPFVGTFLARISKGRTLRQFILGTLIIPSLYSFFWFGVFGGEGIRMQRLADASGVCTAAYAGVTSNCAGSGDQDGQTSSKCASYAAQYSLEYKEANNMGWNPVCVLDPAYHDGYGKCQEFKWTRHVVVGDKCVESTSWVSIPCGTNADPTALTAAPTEGPCKNVITAAHVDANSATRTFNYFASGNPSCFVPAQDNIVCLYNQGTTDIFFDQLASYGPRGFTDLLCVIGLVALVFYFVTSSDSGSFVIDIISANGHPDPPVAQRVFWSITEGATACALLAAGRNLPNSQGSLKALQSCSMVAGLPYTFVLFWCSQSLFLLCREESGEISKDRKTFNTFILSLGRGKSLLKNTVVPGLTMGQLVRVVGGWPMHSLSPNVAGAVWSALFELLYVLPIILVFLGAVLYQWCIVGLVLYIGFAAFLAILRTSVRNKYDIQHGDLLTDFICSFFMPMFTLAQMEEQIESNAQAEVMVANEQKEIDDAAEKEDEVDL